MTSTDMTADELRDLAARTYRTCVERQARIAKRDEEARRAHDTVLARCDELERENRELRAALLTEKARWHTQQAARGMRGHVGAPPHLASPLTAPRLDESVREAELAEAARCERSLRERWEARTDEARAALRDLVEALSLDDGPRTEAIRQARATLERWGMR